MSLLYSKENNRDKIRIIETTTTDCLWILLELIKESILFGNVYVPSQNSKYFKRDIVEKNNVDIVEISVK